ncbi:MAG: ABC transporter ATP-binding protein [Hyphomicrobiaceae bacterium]
MRAGGAHISSEGIAHAYGRSSSNAIQNIDLEVQPGEAVAFIGRSGCGKSTLLHILCGLIAPRAGHVFIDGARVTGPSPEWVMMFQAPSLYPWMTVEQNVALGLKFNRRTHEIEKRVPEMLELVELGDFATRNVQDLSGGQQQRVALARSLALNPKVLLLDEPLSALDAFTRHALQRDIRRIAREMGITLVLVTHEISEAVMVADRAFVLSSNPGEIRSEIAIPLADERLPSSAEFAAVRDEIVAAYEIAAELGLSDTVRSLAASKQRFTTQTTSDQFLAKGTTHG